MNVDYAYVVGLLIGGVISTYLLNLLILYVLLKKYRHTVLGVWLAIAVTLAISTILRGYGMQDGGPAPLFFESFVSRLFPCAFVAAIELSLLAKRRSRTEGSSQ